MQKRKFIKTSLQVGAGALLLPYLSCETPQEENETMEVVSGLPKNWIWLKPELGLSDEQWMDIFTKIRAAGIEAVLPQIYASRKALFDWPGQPVEEKLLERLVPLAHAAGLQIHAWMWSMPCNDPTILEQHPDWYAVNRKGESAATDPAYVDYYKFLCSRKEGVQNFVRTRVEALAKIEGLDGIHFDYIRLPDVILAEALQPKYDIVQDQEFPEYDYCYCDDCRAQYKAQTGIDPMDIEDPAADETWYKFRYDGIVSLVNNHLAPAAKAGGKTVSAAVFPNWESVRQQWHRFELDAFLPMLYQGFYNEDIAWVGEEVSKAKERLKSVNNDKPVYSGLFINHLKPEEIATAIQSSKDGGAAGVCFFAYSSMKEEYWAVVPELLK